MDFTAGANKDFRRFPEFSLSGASVISNPPGPMLLLRVFLTGFVGDRIGALSKESPATMPSEIFSFSKLPDIVVGGVCSAIVRVCGG